MAYALRFNHGDRVIVLDHRGNHEARGTIAGRHETRSGASYDVQPLGEFSLSKRLVGIPEIRLRRTGMTLVKGAA
jgi:hypothetical protein